MSNVGIPTSRTKIVIPGLRPEVLRRARLLTLFDDLLEKKLVIINAPAGYGKTSLLVNFAHQSEIPVCWLSLDNLDKDPKEHFALVVDDFHFVDFIPPIRDIFSRFISLVGENCHVILASRRLPTLPDITLMVARQQVGGFDLEELAFRPDEKKHSL